MKTTEPEAQSEREPELILTEDAQYFLHTAGRWAVFLGIIGFIMSGFILLAAIFISSFHSMISRYQAIPFPSAFGDITRFMGVFYFLIAVFYFICSLYMYQFGDHIKSGITYNNAVEVSDALGKLKSLFKLWGIFTIVAIALDAILLIGVVIGAAVMNR